MEDIVNSLGKKVCTADSKSGIIEIRDRDRFIHIDFHTREVAITHRNHTTIVKMNGDGTNTIIQAP